MIRNGVKKAEQSQYQRYPSGSMAQVSTDWLKRKGNAKEVTFYFFEKDRSGEVRESRARSR